MKNLLTIFGTIFIGSIFLSGCATVQKGSIDRPIERNKSNWEVLGHIRLEYLAKSNETIITTPYDKLLQKAHEQYGALADVIEIKSELHMLSYAERAKFLKEQKKNYYKRYIYNAIVIKYLPMENIVK